MNALEDVLQGLWLDGLSDGGTGGSQLDDVARAKQAIIDWAIGVVGEDETAGEMPHNDYYWRTRNEFRMKLRNKFKESIWQPSTKPNK
jgi:hypothetical protein